MTLCFNRSFFPYFQSLVQCISNGRSSLRSKAALEKVLDLREMLGLDLKLDVSVEKRSPYDSESSVKVETRSNAYDFDAVKIKTEKIDPVISENEKSQLEIEVEQNRLTKIVMLKMDEFANGAKRLSCSECSKMLNQSKLILHYKEHIDSLESKSKEQMEDRGRSRKGKETKKKLQDVSPRDRSSSSEEKVFTCANPTFKVKAGEKKVRKKRERKPKTPAAPKPSKATNPVPEIKLSFDLGGQGPGADGVKEINLQELSGTKCGRGRKRKIENVDASNNRTSKKKIMNNKKERISLVPESIENGLSGPAKERFESYISNVNPRASFPEFLKGVCRQANKIDRGIL